MCELIIPAYSFINTPVKNFKKSGFGHKLDVAVADDFGPKVVGIPVLKLTKALNGEHDPNIPGADDAQGTAEI